MEMADVMEEEGSGEETITKSSSREGKILEKGCVQMKLRF